MKTPRIPEPNMYNVEEDAEVFKGWLTSLLRWFCINKYCGMDLDETI
jgi:hypothetical protein